MSGFVKHFDPVFQMDRIARPPPNNFICVFRVWYVLGIIVGEDLAFVDHVVMASIFAPPFHGVSLGLVPGGYPHEGEVGEVVPIYVYQANSHGQYLVSPSFHQPTDSSPVTVFVSTCTVQL